MPDTSCMRRKDSRNAISSIQCQRIARDGQSCQGESVCGVQQSDKSGQGSEGDLAEEQHSVECGWRQIREVM
jgi:hypothetical protein